ncbi:hypothetical protein ACFQE1_06990 [Halobium palmae]|uniref:Uncharacterized protein n=1 Tax=Halobium palmae TaxID=1776492 RepID=A0ABD5RYX3_9EURY
MAANRTFLLGGGLTALSLLGYAVGVVVAYPGRAFSLTGLMVGLTLLAIGSGGSAGGAES